MRLSRRWTFDIWSKQTQSQATQVHSMHLSLLRTRGLGWLMHQLKDRGLFFIMVLRSWFSKGLQCVNFLSFLWGISSLTISLEKPREILFGISPSSLNKAILLKKERKKKNNNHGQWVFPKMVNDGQASFLVLFPRLWIPRIPIPWITIGKTQFECMDAEMKAGKFYSALIYLWK